MKSTPQPVDISQGDRAYRLLRSEIIRGELMPGERLRAAALQARFALGLTPIREAIGRLSAEGLVSVEPHRGPRVSETSQAELTDLMATRRRIESLCLASAIRHGDPAWEAEIVAALHLLTRTPLPDSPSDLAAASRWETQHRRFHFALVAACDSAWLLRFWNTLSDHSERYRKLRALHHRDAQAAVRDVNAEHHAIAQAVLARDAAQADALMQDHLIATERAVGHFLSESTPHTEQPA